MKEKIWIKKEYLHISNSGIEIGVYLKKDENGKFIGPYVSIEMSVFGDNTSNIDFSTTQKDLEVLSNLFKESLQSINNIDNVEESYIIASKSKTGPGVLGESP